MSASATATAARPSAIVSNEVILATGIPFTITAEEAAVTVAPFESVTFTEIVNGEPLTEFGVHTSDAASVEAHPVGRPDHR